MKRIRYFLLPIAAVFTLGMRGDTVVNFKLPDLRNKTVQLSELLQRGPVLLDFWATWCKPCVKAFPKLEALHQKYREQGLVVVGINQDGPRNLAKVKPFVHSLKITFLVLIDENNEVMRRLQVQNLPTSLLLAPDGTMAARHVGYSEENMKKLEEEIAALLQQTDKQDKS